MLVGGRVAVTANLFPDNVNYRSTWGGNTEHPIVAKSVPGGLYINTRTHTLNWDALLGDVYFEAGTYELSAWFASGAIDRSHMLAVGTLDGRPLASQTWPHASAILTWEKRTLTVTIPTPMTVTVKLGGNWPRIDDTSLTRV